MSQEKQFARPLVTLVTAALSLAVLVGCMVRPYGAPLSSRGVSAGPDIAPDRLSAGGERLVGSGNIVSERFQLRGFDRVDVSHAFRVDIVQGQSFEVVVRIDDNLRPHLQVEKRGDTLVIGLSPLRGFNIGRATLEAQVRLPVLRGVGASGASDLSLSGFSGSRDLDIGLSGASFVEGDVRSDRVNLELSGASRVRLKGSAASVRIGASGASSLDLENFSVEDADIELSGASEAILSLSGTLDIEASGASRLYFQGNPTMGRVELSGASSIKRR